MQLAIRADGGPNIGYGHLVRSGALAEEVLTRGHNVTFATTTPEHVKEVCPADIETVVLPTRDDSAPFLAWLDTSTPDVVFTDAYPIDTDYQRALRAQVPLAVLQDDARHSVCADLLVNGNLYAESLGFDYVGTEPKPCLGPEFALLRRDIRSLANRDPPWRETPEQALITMGGSDISNLTPTVLRAFDELEIAVDAIVGPGFSDEQEHEIRAAAADISAQVQVARDPEDLPKRLFNADFAVSTTSTTTYELLALGTPLVGIPVADNQKSIASALRERDVASVVESVADGDTLKRVLKEYTSNSTLRQNRRVQGRNLVDARGTDRVVQQLLELVERSDEV